jgi:RecB family exonuclease
LIDRPLAYDRARWTRGLTTFDGRLLDPQLARWAEGKAGPAAGQVSTSRLEEYARCPYLFFLKRVMDLESWEEPEAAEGLNPLERGRVIHALLEECIRNLGGERFGHDPLPEIQSTLAQRARAELDRSRPAGIPDLLWEIEREALERTLENWLVFERSRSWDGFVPALLEYAFGDFRGQHDSPPFRLTAGKHTFQFRGRIDRIDLSRNGRRARVIDYKTGRLPLSMSGHDRSPLMGGEKLQIPVYCGAVSAMEGFGAIEEATGEYLYLQPHDTSVVPCSYDSVTLSAATARLVRILEIIGNGIQEGIFFPRTSGSVRPEGHCEFCDFLMICGKDRRQRESLKSQDPAVVRILEMRDVDPAAEDEP